MPTKLTPSHVLSDNYVITFQTGNLNDVFHPCLELWLTTKLRSYGLTDCKLSRWAVNAYWRIRSTSRMNSTRQKQSSRNGILKLAKKVRYYQRKNHFHRANLLQEGACETE